MTGALHTRWACRPHFLRSTMITSRSMDYGRPQTQSMHCSWQGHRYLTLMIIATVSTPTQFDATHGAAAPSGRGAAEPLGELPANMSAHTFVFIIGAHHSGTSVLNLLLCEHHNASCLQGTHKSQDDGAARSECLPEGRQTW